ncbi:MAG: thioredoxin domain-containing protein [Gemmatimonadetes bacterium]|nr:thioredoxin domain-containing protein [Gemmatimonadota bacterium]
MNKRPLLIAGVALAAVTGWIYSDPGTGNRAVASQPPEQTRPAQQQDDLLAERTKGSADAPMTMYEAADFQCPACLVFFDSTLPALEEEYINTGKLKLVFLNFPIPQLHPNAPAAHEFAMCAARQQKFWLIHDYLYNTQEIWAPLSDPAGYFMGLADSAGLDREPLRSCLSSGEASSMIGAEARMAFDAGVQSTPSLILEGGLIRGAAPMHALRPLLDSIYAVRTAEQR